MSVHITTHLGYHMVTWAVVRRFKQRPPLPWTAINSSLGVLVITLLVGHIFHAAINRIAKVEEDYREMMELKSRAEAADVAKSQVHLVSVSLN